MKESNGTVIWIEWTFKNISKKLFVIFGKDISKQIEQEDKLNLIFNHSEMFIYFVDLNGKIIESNLFFNSRILQNDKMYKNQKIKNAIDLVCEDYKSEVQRFYEIQFNEKIKYNYLEFPITDSKNNRLWIGQQSILIYSSRSNENIKGYLFISKDISKDIQQKEKLNELKNKYISNLINTKNIQANFLSTTDSFNQIFKANSIVFKPKEIVSSSFYFAFELNQIKYLIVGDCKLRGVSGAIISMFCHQFLVQILYNNLIIEPGEILIQMEKMLKKTFENYSSNENELSLEITIFTYNNKTKKIFYACAGGNIISLINNITTVHRGETKMLGEIPNATFSTYNTYEIILNKIDFLFFYTDGVVNQYNQELNQDFTLRRLLEIIKKDKSETIENKIENINIVLNKWNENSSLSDDLLLIGIKL